MNESFPSQEKGRGRESSRPRMRDGQNEIQGNAERGDTVSVVALRRYAREKERDSRGTHGEERTIRAEDDKGSSIGADRAGS